MVVKNLKETKTLSTIALVLLISMVLIPTDQFASAETFPRKTQAYLSINPHRLGVGQEMTVNAWVQPWPNDTVGNAIHFEGFKITFTRPDGSKDVKGPMQSETIGSIWFNYYPNQVGQWSVIFDYPGDDLHMASTSPVTTFSVQQDP